MYEAIIYGCVVVLIGYFLGKSRRAVQDNQGEAAVRRALTKRFTGREYHLLNNVTLPSDDGTTQIDHILVSTHGIFIIEVKHYSGWIFANHDAAVWTQVIYRRKSKFQNPIRQNMKHMMAVSRLLDFLPPKSIYAAVVFTGDAEFKTDRPEGVFDLEGLIQYIAGFTESTQSMNRVELCVGRLECTRRLISGKTDVEHEAYLRRKFGEVE